MDYFVSGNYEPFDQWQIELLIESFKYHKIEDKLFISLAKKPDMDLHPEFTKNLPKHERKQIHENIGSIRGHDGLNKFYALSWAVKEKLIEQPFFILEPDMVLHSIPKNIEENPVVSFQIDPYFNIELIQKNLDLEKILDIKDLKLENWPQIGKIIYFNGYPLEFFEETIDVYERILFRQLKETGKVWEYTDQLIWNLQIYNYFGRTSIKGVYDYESNMLNHYPRNFIHYEDGFVPAFHKDMFPFKAPNYISFGNPFKSLKNNAPTGAFNYMSKLAKNYLEK